MTAVDEVNAADAARVGQVMYVSVDALQRDASNRVIDTTSESWLGFAADVKRRSVRQPLLVVADGEGAWRIIDGERRWLAAREAGQLLVPVIESSYVDRRDEVYGRAGANLHREDLHELHQGDLFAEMRDLGDTQAAISDFAGPRWSPPVVSRRLKVVDRLDALADYGLRDSSRAEYLAGHLNVRQAELLADIVGHLLADPPADESDVIAVVGYVLEVAAAEHRRAELDHDLPRMEKETKRAHTVRVERRQLAEDGVRDVTNVDVPHWKFTSAVDVDTDAHATLPCHAAIVTPYGERRLVCTDPDSHDADHSRDAGDGPEASELDDDEDEDRVRSQDEIAEAEAAAAAKRVPTPEEVAAAAQRDAWRTLLEDFRACGEARAVVERDQATATRSKTYALGVLTDQLVADPLFDDTADDVCTILNIPRADDESAEEAVRAYVAVGGDNETRWAIAVGLALGAENLASAARAWQTPATATGDTARAARSYLKVLVDRGYTPTELEQLILAAPPAPPAPPADEADPEREPGPVADVSSPPGDDGTDAPLALELQSRVDDMHAAVSALRDLKKKSKEWKAQLAVVETAKGDVVDCIAGQVADHDAFATALRSIDDASWEHYSTHGPVKTDDDLAEFHATRERLVTAFVDAGVAMTHDTAEDIRHGRLVRFSYDNEGMPDWIRTPDLHDGLNVEPVPFAYDVATAAELKAGAAATEPAAATADVHVHITVSTPDVTPEHRYTPVLAGAHDSPCSACGLAVDADAHFDDAGFPIAQTGAGEPPAAAADGGVAAAWETFVAARAALVKAPKSGAKRTALVEAFGAALADLTSSLVAGHPDPFELTTGLAIAVDSHRTGDVSWNDAVSAVLKVLEDGTVLPPDLVDAAVRGDDLVVVDVRDPSTLSTVQPRRLYVDDVLAAAAKAQA